ncbi:MAG: hypothetical protein LBD93_01035 [Treponema sp.]|jgi:hypothetical protein|nr:hypothetical protein [Treponema sp.]
MGRLLFTWIIFLLPFSMLLSAQDFGFGFDGDEASSSSFSAFEGAGERPAVAISGEVSASMTGYGDDFLDGARQVKLGTLFSGKLNFSASASMAEGIIKLKLRPKVNPISIDEAYIRAYLGRFDIEAGLRKLSWGKADSFGPLDVVNPLDSSEIYPEMADNTDLMGIKIPRPLMHASVRLGQFSKLEGVFVPTFEPHGFAETERWVPEQVALLSSLGTTPVTPDMETLDYAQAGVRFTTTLGSSDLGAQYYYGRLPQPGVTMVMSPTPVLELVYNPYHQIGFDYAQVIYDFNIRAEFAANITEDIEGDDGSVYNPALAWSLGFDRDLFLGINLNVQANETIRLMDDQVGSADFKRGTFDIEGGTDVTATRITATLSRKFLRDELEIRGAAVWGVEDQDFLIMPALIWAKNDVTIACSGGIFGGDTSGQLGQYHTNNFVKIRITYTF